MKSNTKYYYVMRGYKDIGGTRYFTDYTPVDYAYPRVPDVTGFYCYGNGVNSVKISWDKSTDLNAEYLLYRSTSPSGDFGSAIAVIKNNQTSYIDKDNLVPGTKYYYMMRARCVDEGTRYFGNYTSVDYGKPGFPTVEISTYADSKTSSKVNISTSWQDENVQYMIYRGTQPSGDWGPAIATVSGGVYNDTGLRTGTKYYYLVRPVYYAGGKYYFGEYSNMDYAWPR